MEMEQVAHTAAHQKPTHLKALGMVIGAMVMSIGFVVLCGALGNKDFYTGFLFLLCWTVMEKSKIDRLPHTVVGCAVGVLLGYLLQYLLGNSVPMGGPIFGAIVMTALYCQFMGWLPHLANLSMFSFLLVVTIPYVQAEGSFRNAAIALAIGIIYFTPIILTAMHFATKSKAIVGQPAIR